MGEELMIQGRRSKYDHIAKLSHNVFNVKSAKKKGFWVISALATNAIKLPSRLVLDIHGRSVSI